MAWTDEQRNTAIRLWREGRSAAYIAAELQTTITRNAVVGLMHRMGIRSPKCNPHSPVWEQGSPRNYIRSARPGLRKRQTIERRVPMAAAPPIQSRPVALIEANAGDCRWPLNDPRNFEEFRFCGAAVGPGSSYCAGHHMLVHRTGERRQGARHWVAAWTQASLRVAQPERNDAPIEEPVASPPMFAEDEGFDLTFVRAERAAK